MTSYSTPTKEAALVMSLLTLCVCLASCGRGDISRCVYAWKEIPKGSIIKQEQLEERDLPLSTRPKDSIDTAILATGRTANNDIQLGQLIRQTDLDRVSISVQDKSRTLSARDISRLHDDINDEWCKSYPLRMWDPEREIKLTSTIGIDGSLKTSPQIEPTAASNREQYQKGTAILDAALSRTILPIKSREETISIETVFR